MEPKDTVHQIGNSDLKGSEKKARMKAFIREVREALTGDEGMVETWRHRDTVFKCYSALLQYFPKDSEAQKYVDNYSAKCI